MAQALLLCWLPCLGQLRLFSAGRFWRLFSSVILNQVRPVCFKEGWCLNPDSCGPVGASDCLKTDVSLSSFQMNERKELLTFLPSAAFLRFRYPVPGFSVERVDSTKLGWCLQE